MQHAHDRPRSDAARALIAISAFTWLAACGCQRTPSEPPGATSTPAASNVQPHERSHGSHAPGPSGTADPHGASTAAGAVQHAWPGTSGGHGTANGGHGSAGAAEPDDAPSLTWDDPAGWQRVPPSSPMRRAQYRIPHVGTDTVDAELTVITFGPGQGGDTESNLDRWYGQLAQPDGRPTRDVALRREMNVGDITITVTEAPGRLGGGTPMPGAPSTASIERGRLLAAIVHVGTGPWFFKMTGPDATVAAARAAFETMLRSVRVQRGRS